MDMNMQTQPSISTTCFLGRGNHVLDEQGRAVQAVPRCSDAIHA